MAPKNIRLVSWNVNGLNAAMKKGFEESARRLGADVLVLQETKLQQVKLTPAMEHMGDYRSYWSFSTVKKGYSGTAIYTRLEPKEVRHGIGIAEYDDEGRIIEADFGDFILFNIYFPNGQMSPERLTYKLNFYRDFFRYVDRYRERGRHVVIAGDYNTAHNEIDLKNPQANAKISGFLPVEREWLDRLVADGYVDTFRHFYPDTVKYSWWTYRFNARSRNAGWRIDYFFVDREMMDRGWVKEAYIDNDITGSDHCPVGVVLTI